jgi:hypothetical protein
MSARGSFYFINFFNTWMYLNEFKHKMTKTPILQLSSKFAVAFQQHPKKTAHAPSFRSQVRPPQTESEGEGLGVLLVKEAI